MAFLWKLTSEEFAVPLASSDGQSGIIFAYAHLFCKYLSHRRIEKKRLYKLKKNAFVKGLYKYSKKWPIIWEASHQSGY